MRYVSHSNRLSDYQANRTTFWLLVMLLIASVLVFLQIISMNPQNVVLLPSKNQSARLLEVSQVTEEEQYSVTPSQVPLIVKEFAEAYMASESQSAATPTILLVPVPASDTLGSIPQVVNVQTPLDSLAADIEPVVPPVDQEILSPILNATESMKNSGAPSAEEPAATELPVADAPIESEAPVADELSATELPVAEEPAATELPVAEVPIESEAPVEEKPIASEATVVPSGKYNTAFEEEVIRLLNEKRAEQGLSQLIYDSNLAVSTDIRAQEISVLFSHTRPDGSAWNTSGYGIARGENLAFGQSDPTTVISDWMASSTHQDNMLRDIWTIVAVSCYEVNGVTYWVQHFA